MSLQRVHKEEIVVEEKEFIFDFKMLGVTHRVITKGLDEKHALLRLYSDLDAIAIDIEIETNMGMDVITKRTETPTEMLIKKPKKVVELQEAPATVSNGIVFNQPKKVNDPGFQPKFREEIN